MHFSIKAAEDIEVVSIKQHQTAPDVVFSRPLDTKDFRLSKNAMYKCASVVMLAGGEGEHKIAKLPPMVVRWKRVGSDIENAYIDYEDRLRIVDKLIGLEVKEIDHLKQGDVGELHYKLVNYQNQQLNLRIEAIENEMLLLVGTNRRELQLG